MTAVRSDESRFTLFVTDPGGGIFTNAGNAWDGWDGWSRVPQGRAAPGSPVTAVQLGPRRFVLFATDPTGRIRHDRRQQHRRLGPLVQRLRRPRRARHAGHRPLPGRPAPVRLFATDPTGRTRTTAGNSTDGWASWSSVADGQAAPGTPVTAIESRGVYGLFVVDPGGGIFTITSGSAEGGWGGWSSVSQGRTTPGSAVTAVGHDGLFTCS